MQRELWCESAVFKEKYRPWAWANLPYHRIIMITGYFPAHLWVDAQWQWCWDNSGLCLVYKVLNTWIWLCLLLLASQRLYGADQCHLEHAAWWSHKAIHSLSITFHSIKTSLASPQKQWRDVRAVPVCYEACCQTWQWLQATLNFSHQSSLRVEFVSSECAFQSLKRGRWHSCGKAAYPEHLLKKPSWQGREIPEGNTEGKACCDELHRIHSSCSPWVLGNHNTYSLCLWEATDFFALGWACGTHSVVFLLPWIFPQVGSLRAHMKAWAD